VEEDRGGGGAVPTEVNGHGAVDGIRNAEPEDADLFKTLWTEFLEEEILSGGDQRPTGKTLQFYEGKFHEYTSGRSDGIALFGAHGNAVLMWGTLGGDFPWDHGLGRWVPAIGIYVRPEYRRQGWATRMRHIAVSYFKGLGYESSLHGNWPDNKLGYDTLLRIGAEPYQNTLVLRF
jgi:GNAT superfamily N-acetyltransferase